MTFGRFSPEQAAAVRPFVQGQRVHDLGAGVSLYLAHYLVGLGADEVVAVDRSPTPWRGGGYGPKRHRWHALYGQETPDGNQTADFRKVRYVQAYFSEFRERVTTAFVSWPSNYPDDQDAGLVRLVSNAQMVVYLGTNTDGTACGSPDLFSHLCAREALVHVPHRRNTLIVYGQEVGSRKLLPEERAAMDTTRIYSFAELYPACVDPIWQPAMEPSL